MHTVNVGFDHWEVMAINHEKDGYSAGLVYPTKSKSVHWHDA